MAFVKVFLLVAAVCALQCTARKLSQITIAPATAIPNAPLTNQTVQGIADFLESNANYSSFLSLVQSDPVYSVLLSGAWSKGVTNNTVLVANNDAIAAGFKKLADKYNVPSNPGQYLMLANSSGIGENFSATPLNTALAQFIGAILNSHIFSVPVNLYANSSVLSSSAQQPISLPSIALASNFETIVYQNGTADNPLLKLAQPSGLLTDSINVPEVYAQQIGSSQQGRSTLYLYEVPGLFVASQVQKVVADAGTTVDALNTIKTYITQ